MEVDFEDEALALKMQYLANGAVQPVAPRLTMHYGIGGRGPYELSEEGDHVAFLDRPDDVLFVLYRRCHARLVDHLHLGSWAALHGGIVRVGDRRALVVGDKGAGKTTLLLRLLYDGHGVEGDEMVFFRSGKSVCLPRNFHVKPGTRGLIPEMGARWDQLPTTALSDGTVITAFNLWASGFDWRTDLAPVDIVFVLRPDHGGATGCRRLGELELTQALLAHTFPSPIASRALLRSCSALLQGTKGFELTVGRPQATADALIHTSSRT